MSSLFSKPKPSPLNLLKLPTYCVPTKESSTLAAKREAQLQWMRERGMKYLGDPLKQVEKRPLRRPCAPPVRLVSIRNDAEAPEALTGLAREA